MPRPRKGKKPPAAPPPLPQAAPKAAPPVPTPPTPPAPPPRPAAPPAAQARPTAPPPDVPPASPLGQFEADFPSRVPYVRAPTPAEIGAAVYQAEDSARAGLPDDQIKAMLGALGVEVFRRFPDVIARARARGLSDLVQALHLYAVSGRPAPALIYACRVRLGWNDNMPTPGPATSPVRLIIPGIILDAGATAAPGVVDPTL